MDTAKRRVLISLYCLTWLSTLDAFERPGPTAIPSQPDSTYFLSILNGYRQLARDGKIPDQPKAIALPDLTWDSDLADKAKSRAENCVYQYERPLTTGEVYVYSMSADKEPLHAAFDGYSKFEYGKVVYGLGHHLHYTQIVWQNTKSVGCWRHRCDALKTVGKALENAYFTVCKFSPRGNVIGEAPYIYRIPTKWEIPEKPDVPFDRPGTPNYPHLAGHSILLETVNGYRKLVRESKIPGQPRPANLPDLESDRMMFIVVTGRTQECSMMNLNRNTSYTEIAGYTNNPYKNIFHDFFDEYKNYTYGEVGPGWEKTQEYTQMVWAKTKHLNCHTRVCYPFRTLEGEYIDTAFTVCAFSPKWIKGINIMKFVIDSYMIQSLIISTPSIHNDSVKELQLIDQEQE